MVGYVNDHLKCGRLFVRLCDGLKSYRGGGVESSYSGENGPSNKKFEPLNQQISSSPPSSPLHTLDHLHSLLPKSKLTLDQKYQLKLCTLLHNLLPSDHTDPLEVILAVSSSEPYHYLPILPIGSQPYLDAHKAQRYLAYLKDHYECAVSIQLLNEVGLGSDLIERLIQRMNVSESQISKILKEGNNV